MFCAHVRMERHSPGRADSGSHKWRPGSRWSPWAWRTLRLRSGCSRRSLQRWSYLTEERTDVWDTFTHQVPLKTDTCLDFYWKQLKLHTTTTTNNSNPGLGSVELSPHRWMWLIKTWESVLQFPTISERLNKQQAGRKHVSMSTSASSAFKDLLASRNHGILLRGIRGGAAREKTTTKTNEES